MFKNLSWKTARKQNKEMEKLGSNNELQRKVKPNHIDFMHVVMQCLLKERRVYQLLW